MRVRVRVTGKVVNSPPPWRSIPAPPASTLPVISASMSVSSTGGPLSSAPFQMPAPWAVPPGALALPTLWVTATRRSSSRLLSHAAQPAGNPDDIAWRVAESFDDAAKAVEHGDGDWIYGILPPARVPAIRLAHPAQVHTNPSLIFDFIPLNTHAPPFDDARVRRALNYAVDRAKIARMYGPGVAKPNCQALLPGLPGHRPYCPYPHDPGRARALVAASGTRGQRIDVWAGTDQVEVPRGLPAYVTSVLRSLGYRARLHLVANTRITPALRRRIQLSVVGDWLADYPAPSAYLPQFFGCHAASRTGTCATGGSTGRWPGRRRCSCATRGAPERRGRRPTGGSRTRRCGSRP
jgi:ABC-type transport system substrate-binding protein